MNPNKLFAPALLCVAAALLVIASCDKKDENWNPTWAIPVLKESSFTVGKFVNESMVADFNTQIKDIWKDYVNQQFGQHGAAAGADSVDQVAYTVITDSTLNYVSFDNADSIPQLTDSTKQELRNNGLTDDQIKEINDFLRNYYNNMPGSPAGRGTAKSLGAKTVARPKAVSDGQGVIDHLLNGTSNEPTSIFTTVASMLDLMPSFADSIDKELDKILEQANMDEMYRANLKDLLGSVDGIKLIHVSMDINNSLPFQVRLEANFIDSTNDNRIIHPLLQTGNDKVNPDNDDVLRPLSIPTIESTEKLRDIVENTTHIQLKVHLSKNQPLTAQTLRTLADRGIRFNLRVRMRANMSELL